MKFDPKKVVSPVIVGIVVMNLILLGCAHIFYDLSLKRETIEAQNIELKKFRRALKEEGIISVACREGMESSEQENRGAVEEVERLSEGLVAAEEENQKLTVKVASLQEQITSMKARHQVWQERYDELERGIHELQERELQLEAE